MPTTTLTISDQLLSTTAFNLHDEIVDALDINRPFVKNVDKIGKTEVTGGERMIVSWRTNHHSQTTQLTTGYEPINLTVQPVGTPGWEQWCDAIRPIVISGREERLNRGDAELVSILESRLQDTEAGFRAEFEEQALFGGVAALSDMISLNGTSGSGTITGMLEDAAVGAQTNDVHHVDRATHQNAPGLQNQYIDALGSDFVEALYTIILRINRLKGVAGTTTTSIRGYQSVPAAQGLKAELFTQERFLNEKELDGGKLVKYFSGMPLEVTDLPTVATAGPLPASYYFVDHAQIQWTGQSGFYFKLSEFQSQPGYDVRAAYLHLMGQFIGRYFGTSALVTNCE